MNVMLSYRSNNYAFVEKLMGYLRERGINPWIDGEGIEPGQKWRDVLLEQLRTCDACILVLSPQYLESEFCRMEAFVARSFGRRILPIMVEDCFRALRNHEETKGLEDIFMMRMHDLSAVGLPITVEEAFHRMADAILLPPQDLRKRRPVYVSYSTPDGEFATALAKALSAKDIPTWIATLNVRVGENWRDAQVRAMLQSFAHVVVLDEAVVGQEVLRTEILLAEARGLEVFTVLSPRLQGEEEKAKLRRMLDSSDQTYRRLAATKPFACKGDLENLAEKLANRLRSIDPSGTSSRRD